MSEATIRAASDGDVPAIVDMLNAVNPPEERVTLEEFRYAETMRHPRDAFNRLVAAAGTQIVAGSDAGNSQSRPRHMFRLLIAVLPGYRRRGIGTEVERRQQAYAREHGAAELGAVIRASDATARGFLERRGYREAFQRFEMELDVASFDWTPFQSWRDRLGDLRLLTFAAIGVNEENMRKMYDLSMTLSQDVPHPEGPPRFSFEKFQKYFAAPGFRPDALFLLADGEQWVGMSGLFTPDGRPAYTYFTGVRREYRGRGLATALKLATIEFARDNAVAVMRTNNDTVNYPMVAVNEKLGYRRLPARVAMKRVW
ncbi:MAG TPA: GNAT family N-acetyltransferase [bacterium]